MRSVFSSPPFQVFTFFPLTTHQGVLVPLFPTLDVPPFFLIRGEVVVAVFAVHTSACF